jgi:hypothetical protein
MTEILMYQIFVNGDPMPLRYSQLREAESVAKQQAAVYYGRAEIRLTNGAPIGPAYVWVDGEVKTEQRIKD